MAGRLTKLQAVNMMLSAVGIRQVASASSETGSDDASDALRVLNRTNTLIQSRGWPCNTLRAQSFTTDDDGAGGAGVKLDFSTVSINGTAREPLRVECLAPGRYAGNIELLGDLALITTEGTTSFPANTTIIMCDIVFEVDFETECPPDLQHLIVAEATKAFQMDRRANQILDQQLAEQAAKAEITANRGRGPRPSEVHRNDTPLVSGSAPRQ